MVPHLWPDQLVFGVRFTRALRMGDIVICLYKGREIIKRINAIEGSMVYLLGDNLAESTDSRQFGLIPTQDIIAKVMYPRTRLHV